MADHGTPEYSTAAGNEVAQHEETYDNFLALVKWSIILVTLLLVFLFFFVA